MKITYVDRDMICPSFGKAYFSTKEIFIRNDLPPSVTIFVKEHEMFHLRDNMGWWLWMEIKANLYAALVHPIGFVMCCVMSISPYRLNFYLNRFIKSR